MGCSQIFKGPRCDFEGIELSIELKAFRSKDYPFPWTAIGDPTVIPFDRVAVSLQWGLNGTQSGDKIRWFLKFPNASGEPLVDMGLALKLIEGYFDDATIIQLWTLPGWEHPINDDNDEPEIVIVEIEREGCPLFSIEIEQEINGYESDGFGNASRWELNLNGILAQTVLP